MECERCGISSNEVKLFDAIWQGQMTMLCERCAIIENIPIIRTPDVGQLKESEKGIAVYERMRRLSGLKDAKKKDTYFKEDKLKELNSHPELELPERDKLNLVQYFHWIVMKNRREKGLSQKQLAEAIGESEIAIQMIEKAKLPENAEILIRKLEQFFQVSLRKISEIEKLIEQKQKLKKPILLDGEGHRLEKIPEEKPIIIDDEEELDEPEDSEKEIECRIEPFNGYKQKMKCGKDLEEKDECETEIPRVNEYGDLDLRKTNLERVTIGKLKEIHNKKIEVTRQEQIKEQRKIEERKRILEALRERDRIKIEERKKKELVERQRKEEERKRLAREQEEEFRKKSKKEFKDVDRYLGGMELIDENTNNKF